MDMEVLGINYTERKDVGKAIINMCTSLTASILCLWVSTGAFLFRCYLCGLQADSERPSVSCHKLAATSPTWTDGLEKP